jgi:hypothetical protein
MTELSRPAATSVASAISDFQEHRATHPAPTGGFFGRDGKAQLVFAKHAVNLGSSLRAFKKIGGCGGDGARVLQG